MMSDRGFFSGAGLFFDEIPIVEIVDLWFHRKTGRYAVLALLGEDASEEMLWMNGRQFRCFRQQCGLRRTEGFYARFVGGEFHHTFFGPPVRDADYRLVRWFDPVSRMLHFPVPEPLLPPEQVEIDESLRDDG